MTAPKQPIVTADLTTIETAMRLYVEPGAIYEVRIPNTSRGTLSGYGDYNNIPTVAKLVAELSGQAPGLYITLNPVMPTLFDRAPNRILPYARQTTKDEDIVGRRRLLLDFDPKRPPGVSATDQEHEDAIRRTWDCRDYLLSLGLPDQLVGDSGNGGHLIPKVECDNTREVTSLVELLTRYLATRFSDNKVDLDTTVTNPARISKILGTLAAKGHSTLERPHRLSKLLHAPDNFEVLPLEMLRSIVASAKAVNVARLLPERSPNTPIGSVPTFKEWAERHHVVIHSDKKWHDVPISVLRDCPFDPAHKNQSAFVIQLANGQIIAKCHHSSCAGKGWKEFRDAVEPGWQLRGDSLQLGIVAKERIDDPYRLAWIYLCKRDIHVDGLTLLVYRGDWSRWDGSIYRPVDERAIENELNLVVKEEFDRISIEAQARGDEKNEYARKVTSTLMLSVIRALRSLVPALPASTVTPCWIGASGEWDPKDTVVAQNGIVNLAMLARREQGFLSPCTPRLFATTALPFSVTLDAAQPSRWIQFLSELWPNDPDSIRSLRQWIGYFISGDTSHHKILVVFGPPRSGKGTIGHVIRQLVGPENVVAPTLSSLTQVFGLQALLGKSLAIIGDARLGPRSDVSTVLERLLSISGGDSISIDRKYKDAITQVLTVRFLIISNEAPRFADSSSAITTRLGVLVTVRSYLDSEQKDLVGVLKAELPGIFLWAVDGWADLREAGRLLQPESGLEMLHAMEEQASPIKAFLADCCELGSGFSVARDELFQVYKNWLDEAGHQFKPTQETFGKDLHAAIPGLKTEHPRKGGKRERRYVGLRMRIDGDGTGGTCANIPLE